MNAYNGSRNLIWFHIYIYGKEGRKALGDFIHLDGETEWPC